MFLYILSNIAIANSVVTLKQGERAPFDGTLLSPKATARIMTEADLILEECNIDHEREMATLEAKMKFDISNLENSLNSCEIKSAEILEIKNQHIDYLEKQNKRSFSPIIWFTSGVIAGTLSVYGSSLVLKNISQ